MEEPIVSVIIPTYNRAHLIQDALESVFAQTFKDYEVIVIDDGSTDNTREVLGPSMNQIHYFYQENQGISGARNRGILLSRGKYMAFLDSDDRWLPEKLEKQVSYMETHPKVGLLCCYLWRYEIGKENEREKRPQGFPKNFEDLLRGPNLVPTSTVLIRRKCFEWVGTFDTSLPPIEDWDMWLRIARRFDIQCLDTVLSEHRRHPHNTTTDLAKVYQGYWRFYTKIFREYGNFLSDRNAFQKKAISFRYLLGTTYLKRGEMRKALKHIAGSLRVQWSIGTYFDQGHSPFAKVKYFLKPYGALLVSFFGTVFSLHLPWGRIR